MFRVHCVIIEASVTQVSVKVGLLGASFSPCRLPPAGAGFLLLLVSEQEGLVPAIHAASCPVTNNPPQITEWFQALKLSPTITPVCFLQGLMYGRKSRP